MVAEGPIAAAADPATDVDAGATVFALVTVGGVVGEAPPVVVARAVAAGAGAVVALPPHAARIAANVIPADPRRM